MPTRLKEKNWQAAVRQLFSRFNGSGCVTIPATSADHAGYNPIDFAFDNRAQLRWRNAADTDDVRGPSVNALDQVELSEEVYVPMRKTVTVNLVTAAEVITQPIFIAPRACRITGITEIHATAEATAATLTAYVEKVTGTTASGSGVTVMSGTFDLKGTINTMQSATLSTSITGDSDDPGLVMAAGDRLSLVVSAAGTEIAGVQITISLAPCGDQMLVPIVLTPNSKMIDQHVFVADRDYVFAGAYAVWGTAGTSPTLDLKKCSGAAQAPASGTTMLQSTISMSTTANTVTTASLVSTASTLRLAPGNTIAFDFSGTVTSLAKVVVVLVLQPCERWKTVSVQHGPNATTADAAFFTADRRYQIMSAAAIWTTAGGAGANVQLVRDTGTNAPGAGTDLLSNDTNAGFQVDGTANTTEVATFKDSRFNFLEPGDRLSLDYTATTSIVGFTCTVSLKPA